MCARAEKHSKIIHVFLFYPAWDQSEKFVKIYLTLKDVHKIPSENVEVNFTEKYDDNQHIYIHTMIYTQCKLVIIWH